MRGEKRLEGESVYPYEMRRPYEEALRRRQQPQSDIPTPQFQQPTPVVGLPLYSGPDLPQWQPMGDNSNEQMKNARESMAELVKRFRRPKVEPLGEHGPRGSG